MSVKVELASPPFRDERGDIINIINEHHGSVVLITSKKGTDRANHWHRESAHTCFVVSGRIQYFERPVGSHLPPFVYIFGPGEAFYTPPNVEHRMHFLEDTVFLTLGTQSRLSSDYENDLVRLARPLE